MAWSEHQGGNKYKLIERDPSLASRPKRSTSVEMPEEIARSTSEKKKAAWLTLEEEKWSELVKSGEYKNKGKRRSVSRTDKITFADFVPTWKKGYADQNMGKYTRKVNNYLIEKHLIPKFGDVLLDRIKPLHLVAFFAELKRKDGKPYGIILN